ncbi:MAG: hypothetical protein RIM99_19970 [Cyclobacteriaceae bacterium]
MKKLSNLLAALVFVSLVIFISCTSDSTEVPDPLQEQADLLNGSWTVSNVGYINNGLPDVSWTETGSVFTLTISNATVNGGNYATSNVPAGFEAVWPSSGSWDWANTSGSIIDRSDNVQISITNLTASSVTLSFDIANGRTVSGINGDWDFTFSK